MHLIKELFIMNRHQVFITNLLQITASEFKKHVFDSESVNILKILKFMY